MTCKSTVPAKLVLMSNTASGAARLVELESTGPMVGLDDTAEFPSRTHQLQTGDQLFGEGDAGERAFVISEGEIEIIKRTGEREVLLAKAEADGAVVARVDGTVFAGDDAADDDDGDGLPFGMTCRVIHARLRSSATMGRRHWSGLYMR